MASGIVPSESTSFVSLRCPRLHSSTTEADGDFILAAVADTGPGIDDNHLEHIFDRFYRADDDRSRETGGTGLGLAIAKEYVESHHGHIDVNSIKGQGTTFRVWLPIVE